MRRGWTVVVAVLAGCSMLPSSAQTARADALADGPNRGLSINAGAHVVPGKAAADAGDSASATGGASPGASDSASTTADANPGTGGGVPTDAGANADAANTSEPAPVFKPLGKSLKLNSNTDGVLDPCVSPARNGQFYVSWVQKSHDVKLAWVKPTADLAAGPFTVNAQSGKADHTWGGHSMVSDSEGNVFAAWDSNSTVQWSDPDHGIKFAASATGQDFAPAVYLVPADKIGTLPTLWAGQPGQVRAVWNGKSGAKYGPITSANPAAHKGGTWTPPVAVFSDAEFFFFQQHGAAVAVAPDNTVHVVWTGSFWDNLLVSTSKDGGATFGAPVQVNDVKGKARDSIGTFAAVAQDGTLWVTWSDTRNDAAGDIYVDRMAPGGKFGKDELVLDSTAHDQHEPSLHIARSGPCAAVPFVVWADRRTNKDDASTRRDGWARARAGRRTWR